MSLESRVISLAQSVGGDVKTLTNKIGDLTSLTTTNKTNIVGALNELDTLISGAGVTINDTVGTGATTTTWSANKITATIDAAKAAVKSELTNGAAAALDTLSELSAALNNDPTFAATVATELSNRVRFDSAQTLNTAQKLQACTNIGVGNPESDFVASYTAAKA